MHLCADALWHNAIALLFITLVVCIHFCSLPITDLECMCKWQTFCLLICLVELHQTIPENGLACPGEKLQYSCTAVDAGSALAWLIGPPIPIIFTKNTEVNSNATIGDFLAFLTARNATHISSTVTNDMVTSNYDDELIQCIVGISVICLIIDVAGMVVLQVTRL